MSALAAPRALRRRLALPDIPLAVRVLAVLGLALAGGTWWTRMLAPAPTHRALGWAALGAALAGALLLAGRLPRPARPAAAALAAVAALAASLLAAGIPLRLLAPAHWDELGAGIARGLSALPGLLIPYAGSPDGWPARTMLAGGAGLVVLAVTLALWPRRDARGFRLLAAVPLSCLAGIPAVIVPGQGPVGQGLVLFVGLAALLAVDRVIRPDVPVALVALLIAGVAGVALRPALDAERPWFDYEAAAGRLGAAPVGFDWAQGYGAITWPRTGREVLRLKAPRVGLYWKAQDLEGFDGVGWTPLPPASASSDPGGRDPHDLAASHPEWIRRVQVDVRGVLSDQLFTSGETLRITGAPHEVTSRNGALGAFRSSEPLRDGDGYGFTAYVPRPTPRALARAGSLYPAGLVVDRLIRLAPAAVADLGPRGTDARTRQRMGAIPELVVPAWGSGQALQMFDGSSPADAIRGSAYAGVWTLAQRLRGGAATPFAYARRIEAFLSRRPFRYTEAPRPAGVPLADFLLRTHLGYCQHFAGAMALLLRMGGVPARVSTGFAPGERDQQSGEWVVHDTDAHSWVEAYFPGLGWVTFDPTPAASPARGQETSNLVPQLAQVLGTGGAGAAKPLDPRGGGIPGVKPAAAPQRGGGSAAWPWILVGGGVLAALALAALLVVGRRPPGENAAERAFAELERALRRSGRPAAAPVTLRTLEDRLRAAPEAAAYVRAVRALRFGRPGSAPSPTQRRALRGELGRGLGLAGRARAWYALPPRRHEGPGSA